MCACLRMHACMYICVRACMGVRMCIGVRAHPCVHICMPTRLSPLYPNLRGDPSISFHRTPETLAGAERGFI